MGALSKGDSILTICFASAGIPVQPKGQFRISLPAALLEGSALRLLSIDGSQETLSCIIMSFMANIFGAGNSATVFSLKAMERLDAENGHSPRASNAMCMFLALSMSMIQLIPITVIKVRSDLGSASPDDIILPSIAAGLISMAVSVWICKLFERKSPDA